MPDFAANLSTMFTEMPVLDRFATAARLGFDAVEFAQVEGAPIEAFARALHDHHLTLVACELPLPGDSPGLACDPERTSEFREGVRRGIEQAAMLGSRFAIYRASAAPGDAAVQCAERQLVDNLRFAAAQAMAAGLQFLIEAVDSKSSPGALPCSTAEALRLIEAAQVRGLSLCYDVWHMQAMDEPVAETIARHLPRIGHIQIAGYPSRSEPVNGTINFEALLALIDRIGHRGWIGCEYHPAAGTEAGLAWLARHRPLTRARHPIWGMPRPALAETSLRSCVSETC